MICTECHADDGREPPSIKDLEAKAVLHMLGAWKCDRCLDEQDERAACDTTKGEENHG